MASVEDLLNHSQESLNFAIQSANMGTWDINLENNTVSCSSSMLELWNVKPQEFNGNRSILQNKVHPEDLAPMRAKIDDAIKNESIYEMEYRIFPSPGVLRWVKSRGRCTFDPKTKKAIRFSGVVFDISDRKFKDEELALAIKAKDNFFKSASHELKTPLTCLQLQIQVREWDLKNLYPKAFEKERIEEELKKYKEQLFRLTRIVDNILALSEISETDFTLNKEKSDFEIVVRDTIDAFSETTQERGIDISFSSTHSNISGWWDKNKMVLAIQNLLLNILLSGNTKSIKLELFCKEENVILKIKASGKEMPEHLPTDELSNLGLNIATKIIKEHAGDLMVELKESQGAEYTITLPL